MKKEQGEEVENGGGGVKEVKEVNPPTSCF